MSKISILLASLREQECKERIKELTNDKLEYEIVVTSPFPVEGKNVIWVPELERQGNVWAMYQAYIKSSGDYIIYMADDTILLPKEIENMIKFLELEPTIPTLGSFTMVSTEGQEQNHWCIQTLNGNRYLYACYGCINRKWIDLVNGFFDIDFKHSWCDPDFSMRIWNIKNGRVVKCSEAKVINKQNNFDSIHEENTKMYFEKDTKTFIKKWGHLIGDDQLQEWNKFNKEFI